MSDLKVDRHAFGMGFSFVINSDLKLLPHESRS
jgi:hypothetical protein